MSDAIAVKRMKIGQYCQRQRQRCRHVELEQFWQSFASRGFVSDSWAFLVYMCQKSENIVDSFICYKQKMLSDVSGVV